MPASIDPFAKVDGTITSPRGAYKKAFANDMKQGLKNPHHYVNGTTIDDGTTDARAAILAADADGPVVLPPGTYAIASNMTLTNKITFEPGAKLKPASGVTVTLSGGYTAQDTQHVFDISASGTVAPSERPYITPEHFGAIADGTTNDFAAMKAFLVAVRDSGAVGKSIGDGRTYRIGARLELDDTYDGITLDFTDDWIKATNSGWGSNDVFICINGAAAYTGTARDYAHYTINIKEINIDGDYDFAGFLTDLETAYDANPTMSDGDVLTAVSTAQAANGALYNGFSQYVDPSGTGSANPTFELHIDRITVQNLGKGGLTLSNPKSTRIGMVHANNCAVHAVLANITEELPDTAVYAGEISFVVNKVIVNSCQTSFDLSTPILASLISIFSICVMPSE